MIAPLIPVICADLNDYLEGTSLHVTDLAVEYRVSDGQTYLDIGLISATRRESRTHSVMIELSDRELLAMPDLDHYTTRQAWVQKVGDQIIEEVPQ